MKGIWLAMVLGAVLSLPADARPPRSASARYWFAKVNPCPSTGAHRLPCPGYVIDHVVPLCAGGEDAPVNMQWQAADEARVKDREEVRQCRAIRRRAALDESRGE